jgi:hypothetical protein
MRRLLLLLLVVPLACVPTLDNEPAISSSDDDVVDDDDEVDAPRGSAPDAFVLENEITLWETDWAMFQPAADGYSQPPIRVRTVLGNQN